MTTFTNHAAFGPDDDRWWDALADQAAGGVRCAHQGEGTTPRPPRIGLEFAADIEIETECKDLIKHIMGRGMLAALYGPSTVGKTFVSIMVAFSVALGLDLGKRRTRRAPVLYVALEGQGGMRKRIKVAVDAYGDPGAYFARMTVPAVLNKTDTGAEGVASVVAHIKALSQEAGEPVGLVVIDTLARAMAGDDENSAQDMGAFIEQRATEIIRQTDVAVLVVHHTGKDQTKGMRGSYALFGAADAVIRIDESKTVELEKVKDGAEGAWFAYQLEQVTLGIDDDGEPITTCVVNVLDAPKTSKSNRPLSPQAQAALNVLQNLYIDGTARHVPKQEIDGIEVPKCVPMPVWRAACRAKGLTASEDDPKKKADAEKKAFGRARATLEMAGRIGTWGDEAWLIGQVTAHEVQS